VGVYSNIAQTRTLREQQVRAKGIFAMLSKGLELNVISSEFIEEFFKIDYKRPHERAEKKEPRREKNPDQDLIQASSSRKRRTFSKTQF